MIQIFKARQPEYRYLQIIFIIIINIIIRNISIILLCNNNYLIAIWSSNRVKPTFHKDLGVQVVIIFFNLLFKLNDVLAILIQTNLITKYKYNYINIIIQIQ